MDVTKTKEVNTVSESGTADFTNKQQSPVWCSCSVTEDKYLQQKIDHEIKMHDGTAKLLAACKHPTQMLEAAKNLLTSNSRMIAYMSELQKHKTNEVLHKKDFVEKTQIPCKSKISVSELRIPLMWKDTDHFKNKGDHHRYAVFCLWKIGTEIYDTILLQDIDRNMTDLSFDDVIDFNDIPANFECHLEVYCHRLNDDLTIASAPRRIKKKIDEISSSVGRSVGKRLSGLRDDTEFMANMLIGPKYELLANATLKLSDVRSGVQTFDLCTNYTATSSDSSKAQLPLYGHFCCRFGAQPYCLIQDAARGKLSIQVQDGEWLNYWCRLQNFSLSCWKEEDDVNNSQACLVIPITKDTQVYQLEQSSEEQQQQEEQEQQHHSAHSFCIVKKSRDPPLEQTYTLSLLSEAEFQKWWDAVSQHIRDHAVWQHACDSRSEISSSLSQRVPVFLRRGPQQHRTQSLYDETAWKDADDSPMSKILTRLCLEDESTQKSEDRKSKITDIVHTHSRIETDV